MPQKKQHKNPQVGMVFEKKFKGKHYKLTVVKNSGVVGFSVASQVFKTPTAAAKQITKTEVNGWKFWGIDS